MQKNQHRILCARCRTYLYVYHGTFEHGVYPKAEEFKPATSGIPAPKKGEPAVCVECKKPWYFIRQNGALCVMTDQGWKPTDPLGHRDGSQGLLAAPELPPEMMGTRSEFKDPVEAAHA